MTGRYATLRSRFALEHEGVPAVELCVEWVVICLAPLHRVIGSYQARFDAFTARFGARIQLCQSYDEAGMRPYDPAGWSEVAQWLDTGVVSAGAHFQAGARDISAEAPTFDALRIAREPAPMRSGLRVTLPVNVLDTSPDAVAEAFADFVRHLPLAYGFCGLALSCNTELPEMERLYQSWAIPKLLRHPGLGHGDLPLHVLHAEAGFLSMNWLTAVGDDGLERLGGSSALAASLPAGCTVAEGASGGAVVRAGDAPEPGDVNRQDGLPLYRAVAQALRPLWCSEDYLAQVNLMYFDEQARRDWLLRFF